MKEYREGVISKAQEEEDKWKDHMIGKEGNYTCTVCKKIWVPCIDDINRKRMTTYYKLCSECRTKSYICRRMYKKDK
jgi:hypothetical protein